VRARQSPPPPPTSRKDKNKNTQTLQKECFLSITESAQDCFQYLSFVYGTLFVSAFGCIIVPTEWTKEFLINTRAHQLTLHLFKKIESTILGGVGVWARQSPPHHHLREKK
jgi:hypothetical protein